MIGIVCAETELLIFFILSKWRIHRNKENNLCCVMIYEVWLKIDLVQWNLWLSISIAYVSKSIVYNTLLSHYMEHFFFLFILFSSFLLFYRAFSKNVLKCVVTVSFISKTTTKNIILLSIILSKYLV